MVSLEQWAENTLIWVNRQGQIGYVFFSDGPDDVGSFTDKWNAPRGELRQYVLQRFSEHDRWAIMWAGVEDGRKVIVVEAYEHSSQTSVRRTRPYKRWFGKAELRGRSTSHGPAEPLSEDAAGQV